MHHPHFTDEETEAEDNTDLPTICSPSGFQSNKEKDGRSKEYIFPQEYWELGVWVLEPVLAQRAPSCRPGRGGGVQKPPSRAQDDGEEATSGLWM